MSAIFRPQCLKSIRQLVRNYSPKPSQNAVVIAAAVRTPNSFEYAQTEDQLAGLIIDELVKRTAVPREEFKKLFVCTSSDIVDSDSLSSVVQNLGLKSCQTHAIQNKACSVSGLQMSLECLQQNADGCIILGDTRAHIKQQVKDSMPSELITARMRPSRKPKATANTAKDGSDAPEECPGAAALALTTMETAERLQLQPLAVVREFFIVNDNKQAIYRLSNKQPIQLNDVHNWQLVVNDAPEQHLNMLAELNVKHVRTHDVKQSTASHVLTHTVHALPAGSLGCVIMESGDGRCVLMVLEKIMPATNPSKNLPQLTLYTKEPCPLCDELLAQLDQNFAGEFELKKVFIDRKENVRYLRLFRYDIPVLFLNGQFLCMHTLNEKALRDRLSALKLTATAAPSPAEPKKSK
ncbi:uncharacterized protein LOC6562502 isoform X2 [Drosophila grimshawi]|uniref:GH10800 n=1 Tax=Drosophila grimshawi TaxID=7222 RepID=B4JB07_DROGR|nr:uncharacterized protein LOC6562502 isoform X2 [Drosophila grimshawi]EDW02877.1 GH10800 [Drosophila grimshawi]